VRVIIVEDEVNLARGLAFNLEREGLETTSVATGEEALEQYEEFDLMILDVGLPGMDGFEVLRRVRAQDERYPVLMLTARAAEEDRVEGLTLGADDYIAKPFSLKELLLRVKAKLKQVSWYAGAPRQGTVTFGEASFDLDRQLAQRADETSKVTVREQALVRFFLDNPERVVSRRELLREVWGYSEEMESRTPDTFMARLRKLVEPDPAKPRFLVSVRGQGYKFLPDGVER